LTAPSGRLAGGESEGATKKRPEGASVKLLLKMQGLWHLGLFPEQVPHWTWMLDRIAAVVNEGIVLQSQVEEQMATIARRLRDQGQQVPPTSVLRQQVLERLVMQEVQVQRAGRLGIEVSDEMLNNALRNVAQQNKIDFDRLPEALAAEGIDYPTYRSQVRREMMLGAFLFFR
jgi:hypothetical protein